MFGLLYKKAIEIINIHRQDMQESYMRLGKLTKEATDIDMMGWELAWTTDDWAGPNDETYSTVTEYFITEQWSLESGILDFQVFKGSTTGEVIYYDMQAVLDKFKRDLTVLIYGLWLSMKWIEEMV